MIIDNSKVVIQDRKMMYMMTIGLTILIPIFCFADIFENSFLGISREYYVIIVCCVYLIFYIYRFILDLNFFYYNDQSEKLLFKFYSLRPFMKKRRSIEILKGSLVKYEIKTSVAGQKKTLILYQRIKNKIAKYPPISISALNTEEQSNLVNSLNANVSNN